MTHYTNFRNTKSHKKVCHPDKNTIHFNVARARVLNFHEYGKKFPSIINFINYNLSVSTYVESEDTSEAIDITELNKRIGQIVERENKLRAEIDAIIAEIEVR